jgi:hypothetical protein
MPREKVDRFSILAMTDPAKAKGRALMDAPGPLHTLTTIGY